MEVYFMLANFRYYLSLVVRGYKDENTILDTPAVVSVTVTKVIELSNSKKLG